MEDKWLLYNDSYDFAVYMRGSRERGLKDYLHIDKKKECAYFESEEFVLHSANDFVPQQAETNEWVKFSAKYGAWYRTPTLLKESDLEFAIAMLQKVRREK